MNNEFVQVGDPLAGVFTGFLAILVLFVFFLLYAFYKSYKYQKYGRDVYIIKGRHIFKTKGILLNSGDDEDEFSIRTSFLDVLRNTEPRIHVKRDLIAKDVVYLLQVGVRDYRYVDLNVDDNLVKIVYNDNEALAKEKFVKNMRLIATRFILEDKLKKWLNIAAILIAVIGILVLFSIISDTQQKIADKYVDVVKKQQEIQEKYANGTYLVEACRQIELQKYTASASSAGAVVITK